MTQVFISYSRKDLEFVDLLANDLKTAGFDVWYDLSGLEAGSRWGSEIQKAIQASQFFLVTLSPNSIKSDWVEREFLFASEQGLKIIPLLYQPCHLPMWSLNLHFIDMQGRNYSLHLPELLKIMGVKPASEDENPIATHYIKIGDEYRKRGQTSQAIESYQQALQADPGFLKARSNIGAIYLFEQAYSEAAEAFEQVLQVSSEDLVAQAGWSDANMALGNQARAEGRIDEAAVYYQEILRFVPHNGDALQSLVNIYVSRAETLLNAGQEDDAFIALSEAQKYSLDDQNLASRLKKLQEGKRARLVNEQFARVEVEISTGKFDQAIAILNEALLVVPGEASLLKKIKDIEKQQLKKRLDAILSKVNEDEKIGHWEPALAGLNEYLQLKPDDSAIQKRLAELITSKHAAWLDAINLRVDQSLEKHNWDGALNALQEALSLEPENKELKTRVVQVQSDRRTEQLNAIFLRTDQAADSGRWDEAIDIIKTGLSRFPDEDVLKTRLTEISRARQDAIHQSTLRLADVAARAGKWETAVNSLNEVLAAEPENVEFLQKLDQVRRLERDSKIQDLKTNADELLRAEKYDQALALWNKALTWDTGNRQAILKEIEAVIQTQKLASDYSDAKQAFAEKDYEKAVNLFQNILKEQSCFKDAAKLLARSQKRIRTAGKTPQRVPHKIWLIGSLLAILALAIGSAIFWIGKNGFPAMPELFANNKTTPTITTTSTVTDAPTITVTPSATINPTRTPFPTATATPLPSWVTDFAEPILAAIKDQTPDYQDDFSQPSPGWNSKDSAARIEIAEGVLTLSCEAGGNCQFTNPMVVWPRDFVLQIDTNLRGLNYQKAAEFAWRQDWARNSIVFSFFQDNWILSYNGSITIKSGIYDNLGYSHITIICRETEYAVYLNSLPLMYFNDPNSPTGNEIYFTLWNEPSSSSANLEYDNLKVWNLDDIQGLP